MIRLLGCALMLAPLALVTGPARADSSSSILNPNSSAYGEDPYSFFVKEQRRRESSAAADLVSRRSTAERPTGEAAARKVRKTRR